MDAPAILEDMTGRGGIARGYGYEKADKGRQEEEKGDEDGSER